MIMVGVEQDVNKNPWEDKGERSLFLLAVLEKTDRYLGIWEYSSENRHSLRANNWVCPNYKAMKSCQLLKYSTSQVAPVVKNLPASAGDPRDVGLICVRKIP